MFSLKLDDKIFKSYDNWELNTLEIIKENEKTTNEGNVAFYLKR